MNATQLYRALTVKRWIKSCETDDQIDSCVNFINRHLSVDNDMRRHLRNHVILQRLIVNNMDDEAMSFVRQCEGDEILKSVSL